MHVIADFTLIPLGVGISLSPFVAEVEKILSDRGLVHVLHANGTNVEGDWDDVMGAIRQCHDRLHQMGAPRIHTSIKLGTRIDRAQTMEDKLASVRQKLNL